MDANGNVVDLVAASTGTGVGSFEYDAFGQCAAETEPSARAMPFRFSTKYEDFETGNLYYGFRYYSSNTGRWLSRDPIAEGGGINLYSFVSNNPINEVDVLGHAGLGGAGVVGVAGAIWVDSLWVPDLIDDAAFAIYGGREAFMDYTEARLAEKGDLPPDMFRKARALDDSFVDYETDLGRRIQKVAKNSDHYVEKRDFIIKRLKEGTRYDGFLNVDFKEANEGQLGWAVGGGQLHYKYFPDDCDVYFWLVDTYDFTGKGHMWAKLEEEGLLATYEVDVWIEGIIIDGVVPEK